MLLRGFILTLFLLSLKPCIFAQEGGTKYIIHPAVGDVLDSAEAKKYLLFTQFEGFKKAVFFKVTDSTFYAELQYRKDDSLINIKRNFPGSEISALTEKIKFMNIKGDVSQFQKNIRRPLNSSEYGYSCLYYPRLSVGAGISYKYINFDNIKDAFTRIEDKIIQTILDSGKQNVYRFSRRDKNFSAGPLLHANIRYIFSPNYEISASMMWGMGETEVYSAQMYFNIIFPGIINEAIVPFAGIGVAGTRIRVVREYKQSIDEYRELKEISFTASGLAIALSAGLTIKLSKYINTHLNILYPFHTTLSQSNSDGSETEFKLNTPEVGLIFSFDF